MDNQRSPRWFSTPLGSPLSFGLRPTRAQGSQKPSALLYSLTEAVTCKTPLHLNPHQSPYGDSFPQGKSKWRYIYCGRVVRTKARESFLSAVERLRRKREKKGISKGRGKPQVVLSLLRSLYAHGDALKKRRWLMPSPFQ